MAKGEVKPFIWSDKAVNQFLEILEYISKTSENGSNIVSKKITDKAESLSFSHNHYPLDKLKVKNNGNYRVCFVFRYKISFKCYNTKIEILSIRHTSRTPLSH